MLYHIQEFAYCKHVIFKGATTITFLLSKRVVCKTDKVIYNSLPNDGVKFLNNKIYLKQSEEDMTPVVKDPLGTNFATIAT